MNTMTNFRARLASLLVFGGFTGAAIGCYGVDFDDQLAGVFYCQSDADCLENQACEQFRCVDDTGPALQLTLPEPLTPFGADETTMAVQFNVSGISDFLSDSNENVDGKGKVAIAIDGDIVAVTNIAGAQVQLDQPLEAGAHQLSIQAVFGDETTPYANPSASDFTTFYTEDVNGTKPQVAIVSPAQGHVHVLGEPLHVEAAVRNFRYVENGDDCIWESACDPFEVGAMCTNDCETVPDTPEGHSHAYLIENYPDCLGEMPLGCNGSYALSMRLSDNIQGDEDEVSGDIPANRFETTGPVTLTITLQYNQHDPYPNEEFVIFDQITIDVVDP